MSLRVAIAGAGIGGLCLAQGLRRAGIEVAVYERDPAALARGQGYRLRLDHEGHAALRSCLPDDLFALHEATANEPYMSIGAVYDQMLTLLYTHGRQDQSLDPTRASRGINRLTLRQVLLAGLTVHFGHTAAGYEVDGDGEGDGVRLLFAEGGSATADLLVGAEGINSAIRGQLLPAGRVVDTGLRAIYGQTRLDDQLIEWLPEPLFGGSSPVLGPSRRTLALGSYQPVLRPEEAVARFAPYAHVDPVPDYMKWTLVAPADTFALTGTQLWQASPEALHTEATRCVGDWHPAIVKLVEHSDVEVTFPLSIRAGAPVPQWRSGRVTLLGDAIHATTPVGGTGANTALRDAAVLSARLRDVVEGRSDLIGAVREYEAEMREYGTAAVARSLVGAEKIFRADPAEFTS